MDLTQKKPPLNLIFPIPPLTTDLTIKTTKPILPIHSIPDQTVYFQPDPNFKNQRISQEKVQEFIESGNLADITLAGYTIKLLRNKRTMTFKELYEEVSKRYDTLRRSDGSKYEGDVVKALKGCLTSSNVFKEVGENVWTIRDNEAKIYEENANEKLRALITKKQNKTRKKRGNKVSAPEQNNSQENSQSIEGGAASGVIIAPQEKKSEKSKKKTKRPFEKYKQVYDMLDVSCKAFKGNEATSYLMKNPFRNLKGGENPQELWQKLGSEKFIGMLQCFDYFSPLLEEYVKNAPQKEAQGNKGSLASIDMLKADISDMSKKIVMLEKQLKSQGDNNLKSNS